MLHKRTSVKRIFIVAAVAGAVLSAAAAGEPEPFARCETLGYADFSRLLDAPTQITQTKLIAPEGGLPTHCEVTGYIWPKVGFGLRLPLEHWNGKLVQTGCGGNCGQVALGGCDEPLRRGYACIVSDMGHQAAINDALWAYDNLEGEVDFGYRATHVTALAGKAIVERYYSAAPRKSYFIGCSQGGRQGLVEAQRFPHDFDGIIAGSPPVGLSGHWLHLLWRKQQLQSAQGSLSLSRSDLELLNQVVMSACDGDDGTRDGIISQPAACRFDPTTLLCKRGKARRCLTADQIEVVKKVYADGWTAAGERVSRGELPGTELHWDRWYDNRVDEKLRYMVFWPDMGPEPEIGEVDFDVLIKRRGIMESLYDNSNPDLRRFKAAGGKLLLYHGWADQSVSPLNVVDYYQTVERTLGSRATTQVFFRLFMVPGMNHCTLGDGPFLIDYLSYLEAWVEQGKAPDTIIGAHVDLPNDLYQASENLQNLRFPLAPGIAKFTRPIFPYPQYAKYNGSGDPNDAANFIPVTPSTSLTDRRIEE